MTRISLEQALSRGFLGTVKVSEVLTGMLDTAKSNSEAKIMENEDFFYNNLMKDKNFVSAMEDALKRGVKVEVLLCPTYPRTEKGRQEMIEDQINTIMNQARGAYAYGGVKNLATYIIKGPVKDNSMTKEKAYAMAKDLENKLGNKKYWLRVQGFFGKLFGNYQTLTFKNKEKVI